MNLAAFELIIGVALLTWFATLGWSLFVILTTPQPAWRRAQMSQVLWLAVVIFMPLLGTLLFALSGYRRLRTPATSQQELI